MRRSLPAAVVLGYACGHGWGRRLFARACALDVETLELIYRALQPVGAPVVQLFVLLLRLRLWLVDVVGANLDGLIGGQDGNHL